MSKEHGGSLMLSLESQWVFQNLLLFLHWIDPFALLYNRSHNGPLVRARETLRFKGNKMQCSPRNQSLSVKCMCSNSISDPLMRLAKENELHRKHTCPPFLSNFIYFTKWVKPCWVHRALSPNVTWQGVLRRSSLLLLLIPLFIIVMGNINDFTRNLPGVPFNANILFLLVWWLNMGFQSYNPEIAEEVAKLWFVYIARVELAALRHISDV